MVHLLSETGSPEEPNVPHHVPLQRRPVHVFIYPVCVCVKFMVLYNMAGQLQIQSWLRCGFFIVEMFGRKDRKTGKSDALIHML